VKPGLVVLDSLSRLTVDSIEDSSVATKLMKRLREIAHKHVIALVLIHHSQKMDNKPVTISSLAGSRIVGQEMDFMIGINRTTSNIRYLKDVAYRYWPDDAEFVRKFNINFQQIIEPLEEAYESEIISNASSVNMVYDSDISVKNHLMEMTAGDPSILVKTAELYDRLVNSGVMTKPTLHASLKRLEQSSIIEKPQKGCYRLFLPS
jgi:predicted ATP-dependent serine protease